MQKGPWKIFAFMIVLGHQGRSVVAKFQSGQYVHDLVSYSTFLAF